MLALILRVVISLYAVVVFVATVHASIVDEDKYWLFYAINIASSLTILFFVSHSWSTFRWVGGLGIVIYQLQGAYRGYLLDDFQFHQHMIRLAISMALIIAIAFT